MYSDIPVYAVAGKNYGDEGKGLATDYFVLKRTSCPSDSLVIRHNGGAQAGHTVDMSDGRRFVFHQLSSGSFRGASTLWADTFMPDLYKLEEEVDDFRSIAEVPKIYASLKCSPVVIFDVLLNQALEDARRDDRHGSCGMGINEADLRRRAGFGIGMETVLGSSAKTLYNKLTDIRKNYVQERMHQIEEEVPLSDEYIKLINDDNMLCNYIDAYLYNAEKITGVDDGMIFKLIDNSSGIVFEGAQGLLLDTDYKKGAPHLTSSKTGLNNPASFCKKFNLKIDEAVYVSRSYVTRHGNGPLPLEMDKEESSCFNDLTNVPNPWQGELRYAYHESPEAFVSEVISDMNECEGVSASLFLTHLNETDGRVLIAGDGMEVDDIREIRQTFGRIYRSFTPYSEDIVIS